MTIQSYIQKKRIIVSDYLQTYLKQTVLPQVSPIGKWGNDGVTRILQSTLQGKMLRATLVYLSEEIFTKKTQSDAALKTAAALELIQTGFLIHDDIMDNDETRRGGDSMHIQYQKILSRDGVRNAEKTAESFAICLGDMAFFLGFQILSDIHPPALSQRLIRLFSSELTRVCVAQMQDVYGGNTQKQLSQEDILSVYTHKTGRYSCGLPLVAGATIAGAPDQTLPRLWKLGTALGILFQIQDDALNLFGNPKQTGKPVGSDIREGKQTLHRYFLMKKAPEDVKKHLVSIFGNPNITERDIRFVKKYVTTLRIDDAIHAIVEKQEQEVQEILKHVFLPGEARNLLEQFVRYITEREK